MYTSLHHAVEQRLEIIHMLIDDEAVIEFFKELLRALDLGTFDRPQLERGERCLRLRDEVDVPHLPLTKHNRPVRRITSDRRWDGEPARQLRIDQHLVPAIKRLAKVMLHLTVCEHIDVKRKPYDGLRENAHSSIDCRCLHGGSLIDYLVRCCPPKQKRQAAKIISGLIPRTKEFAK